MTGFYWANVVEPEYLAQPADLATYMGIDVDALPTNVLPVLRSCTNLVSIATQGSFYDVDPDTGLPLPDVDPITGIVTTTIVDAMTRATCIQAAAWITLGIDPFLAGVYVAKVKTGAKIGTASTQYADAQAAAAAREAATNGLVPEALRVLLQHNLIGNTPWTFG